MSSAPSFEKVGECLYRNPSSGTYYALVKIRGKQIKKSLKTKDLQTARRKLKDKRRELEQTDQQAAKLSLAHYADAWLTSVAPTKSKKFQKTREAIVKSVKEEWPGGSKPPIGTIPPAQIREFLAKSAGTKGWSRYNSILGIVKAIFTTALESNAIIEIPGIRGVKKKDSIWARRKQVTTKKPVPSVEQFRAIVANIRSQEFADTREEAADFVEAEGTLGLGQAEIAQLSRHDIDLDKNIVRVRRQKTDRPFTIPLYPQAKPVIERRLKIAADRKVDRLFSIADPKVAVTNACKRLKLPTFTQRSFRKMFVTEGLRSRVSVKIMADLQGHKDGGKLILQTYSDVIAEDERQDAAAQIAKAFSQSA